jgi:hypothetical protein
VITEREDEAIKALKEISKALWNIQASIDDLSITLRDTLSDLREAVRSIKRKGADKDEDYPDRHPRAE